MYKSSLVLFGIIIVGIVGIFTLSAKNQNTVPVYVWMGCDGNAVTRTEVGKIVITHIAKNTKNCNGPKSVLGNTGNTIDTDAITEDTTGSLNMFNDDLVSDIPKKSDKILLDLSQKDIVNYRVELIKQEQIRYANAIRSLRIRQGKSLESNTKGYLIKNDAVKVTGDATGWTPVKSGEVVVTDERENTIAIDTTKGTTGYVGTRFLRNATPSDLVKIGQADIAYWSDIVHTNVDHLVNVRSNPWYTAPIVQTVPSNVPMYRVATIDNWSQVQSIDGTLHGYIRSDFLIVDNAQLIEIKPLLK